MLTLPLKNSIPSEKKEGILMRTKYRKRSDSKKERYVVYLDWGGRWQRTWEDDGSPIESERRAFRLCERIDGDIEQNGKNFDPRRWFKSKSKMRLDRYAREWLGRQTKYAPGTWPTVRQSIRLAIEYFGDIDIREVRRGHLEDYLATLTGNRQVKMAYLHKLYADAFAREEITRIPPFPQIPKHKSFPNWLTKEEQEKVLLHIKPRHRPIVEFAIITGCRKSEARALMWEDVDWEKGIVTIRRTFSGSATKAENLKETKTGEERLFPLIPKMVAILKPIRGLGGFVFRNQHGRPYNPTAVQEIWIRALKKAKVKRVPFGQATRHSKASQLASEGESLWAIAKLLGHRDISTTQRYAEVDLAGKGRLME